MADEIRSMGGEIFAISSEPQRLASQAQTEWGLAFETIGDPHHEISKACADAGWLKLVVNTDTARFEEDPHSPYRHPKGYFQPGVLAVSSEGRVLYRWRSRPTRENMGGATSRPTAQYVFEQIARALNDDSSPGSLADAGLDTNPEVDSRGMPWPLFVPLLVANGWFLRPNTFGQMIGGPPPAEQMKRAALRIPFFLAAWIGAAILLPKAWVGGVAVAAIAWVAWIGPQILKVSRSFQPELPEDSLE